MNEDSSNADEHGQCRIHHHYRENHFLPEIRDPVTEDQGKPVSKAPQACFTTDHITPLMFRPMSG